MTTQYRKPDTYRVVSMTGRRVLRVPLASATRLLNIEGRERVQAVLIEEIATGDIRRVECDTVIFTGDWIPDKELARSAGLEIASGSRGVSVDTALRSSSPGIFAVGNLVHPVDTADIAALDGRHVATAVMDWLQQESAPDSGLRIDVEAPLRWIAPSRLEPGQGSPARQ